MRKIIDELLYNIWFWWHNECHWYKVYNEYKICKWNESFKSCYSCQHAKLRLTCYRCKLDNSKNYADVYCGAYKRKEKKK